MKVILAGYTLDADIVEDLKNLIKDTSDLDYIAPETISAAYARISRDPAPVNELRKQAVADVAQAKKSNEAIVFGMGHHSVAEHVQLNFDILGISRLAIEALEEARLCAYTEKSQRYITLDGDYVVPKEITDIPELQDAFHEMIAKQNEVYQKAVFILTEFHKNKVTSETNPVGGIPNLDAKTISACEGRAKEDARYVLSMATEGQLGFSANARNLEYIIRKLSCHPLEEVCALSRSLYNESVRIVPSLIRFANPEEYFKKFGRDISNAFFEDRWHLWHKINQYIRYMNYSLVQYDTTPISLLHNTNDPDLHVLCSIFHSNAHNSYPFAYVREFLHSHPEKCKQLVKDLLVDMTEFDAVYREFEHVSFTFELIVSSSAFAQWKRHRIATITKQGYNPDLGYTYPYAVTKAGLSAMFREVYDESTNVWIKLLHACKTQEESAADYILTNGHRRRILITANLRELYHIARLRMDKHAQWEIREQASRIIEIVKEVAPLTAMLACGKDQFADLRKEVYK